MMIERNVSHPAISRFATLADAFCELVQQSNTRDGTDLLTEVHRLLPRIYAAGLELPSTSVLFDDSAEADGDDEPSEPSAEHSRAPDPDRLTSTERRTLFDALTLSFGEGGYYREVYNPYDPPEQGRSPVASRTISLISYSDLLLGLRKWRRDDPGEALWEWRFGFETHCGEHATGALRALHARSAWHDLDWPGASVSKLKPIIGAPPSDRIERPTAHGPQAYRCVAADMRRQALAWRRVASAPHAAELWR
jgi:hypothetical protein